MLGIAHRHRSLHAWHLQCGLLYIGVSHSTAPSKVRLWNLCMLLSPYWHMGYYQHHVLPICEHVLQQVQAIDRKCLPI